MSLRLDWCSHDAAKFAVEHWHYSKTLPAGKLVKIGVWEDEKFIGCIIFGRGANNNIGKPFNLNQTECVELVRVALTVHQSPVSRIVAIALKLLRKLCPGIRLIVSYADPLQGHYGGIYQATGWLYTGKSQAQQEVMFNGKIMHKRTANALFGTIKGMQKSPIMWKHKYLLPLDERMKQSILHFSKPYPKCADGEMPSRSSPEESSRFKSDVGAPAQILTE